MSILSLKDFGLLILSIWMGRRLLDYDKSKYLFAIFIQYIVNYNEFIQFRSLLGLHNMFRVNLSCYIVCLLQIWNCLLHLSPYPEETYLYHRRLVILLTIPYLELKYAFISNWIFYNKKLFVFSQSRTRLDPRYTITEEQVQDGLNVSAIAMHPGQTLSGRWNDWQSYGTYVICAIFFFSWKYSLYCT